MKYLLKQAYLSPMQYQQAKNVKGFEDKNYEWNASKQLYKKL